MHSVLENREERQLSEDLGGDCMILKCTSEHRLEGISWIHVVQDRDNKRAFVSMVMNLRVPCNEKNVLADCGSISFLTLPHIAHQLWITWTYAVQNAIRPPPFRVDRPQYSFTTIRPILRDATYVDTRVYSLCIHFIYATMLQRRGSITFNFPTRHSCDAQFPCVKAT